ncbi:MAG: hypothetical protein HQL44_05340 [Alphaproteobacteria bacterium]|nr:hypothetical protein [Alphaproteobacteria bacterium]
MNPFALFAVLLANRLRRALPLIRLGLTALGLSGLGAVGLASRFGFGDPQFGPLEQAALVDSGLLLAAAGLTFVGPIQQQLKTSFLVILRLGLGLVALLAFAVPAVIAPSPEFPIDPNRMWLYVTLPCALGIFAMAMALLPRTIRIQLIIFLSLVALMELGTRAVGYFSGPASSGGASAAVSVEGTYYSGYFEYDSLLGYRGRANRESRSIRRQGEHTIYDVRYTIGPEGFRETPQANSGQKTFAAFFGDSFTVGEGVEDDETLPAQFSKLLPQLKGYNYGFHGYGPQQMLALLNAGDRLTAIAEREGYAFYLYLPSHILRLKGSLQVQAWGHHMPRYILDSEGQLKLAANFTTGRPVFAALYPLLVRSRVLKLMKFDPWATISESDEYLAAAVFQQACARFAERFVSKGCTVVFFPGSQDEAKRLTPRLREVGVNSVDLSSAWGSVENSAWRIQGDGHATALGYRDIAERLSRLVNGSTRQPLAQ